MKPRPHRPYRQRKRAASAAHTRARVLRAARQLFERRGSAGVGIDDVAERAGVARATVFQIFGSKAGLLDAIAVGAQDSPEFGAIVDAVGDPDPVRAVRRSIDAGCVFWAKNMRLAAALAMLAATDRDVARAVAQREAARAEGLTAVVRRLAAAGRLRHGLGRGRATEILLLATSFSAFEELRQRQGLAVAEIQHVLRAIVERTLLGGD